MKKKLLYSLLLRVLILFLLTSCRTEDGYIQQQQQKDLRFSVFVPKKEGESINYADGFAFLMKRYDSLHKTNLSGVNHESVIGIPVANKDKSIIVRRNNDAYIEFRVRSQTITEQDGEKWVVFPKVENSNVSDLVIATLSEKETKVVFALLNRNSEFYKELQPKFQLALDRFYLQLSTAALLKSNTKSANNWNNDPPVKEQEIEEVIIPGKPKDKDSDMPVVPINISYCINLVDCYVDSENIKNNSGGGAPSPGPFDEWMKNHINEGNLKDNKCANAVYQTLKSRAGLFYNLLGNFKGESSVLNLSFNVKYIPSEPGTLITGQTYTEQIQNGYVRIDINTEALGSTALGIAKTFIHEMIHAKMFYDLVNAGWDGIKDIKEINPVSLPTLLRAYQEYKYEKGEDAQHKFMSEYYIPKIGRALAQFDGHEQNSSVYENLAWTGLQRRQAYEALSKAKRDKITEANNNFNRKAPCGK
ncbi:hypothetical protein ATB99_16400 [Elizabethkingia meningoseptica]|uniref:hypothetical protein n=1 Tax=Elizabethkingia meningoseptica TaxID=238 RepID=UPI000332D6FC|nr:hypothetical protein [Elizabethkingia meningoseptica]AQX06128.1 hypothetical protein BBD33_13085 [Elizabethkingia meningoseptica]AQX48174.1 hypothetical protein B5G46_13075 [Elizabethkingia meningoseptica]EOR29487.1 hypothetical protein L100_11208 [Elizabethkingia meningoseptica ATCC 13253 = NBRC 12535]KUY23361.1 hypothetical protein ATB99_16400 [Elizabethkingia meningoseptica]OPB71509.1 hypothetical protein BAY30_02755 [Elizabethkingia meningoseptica]